jgi:hypothetical protein
MSPKLLQQNLTAAEAKPFKISLSDGGKFSVPHTDYCMVANDGEQLILLEHGNVLRIVDTEHIISIEFDIPRTGKRARAQDKTER